MRRWFWLGCLPSLLTLISWGFAPAQAKPNSHPTTHKATPTTLPSLGSFGSLDKRKPTTTQPATRPTTRRKRRKRISYTEAFTKYKRSIQKAPLSELIQALNTDAWDRQRLVLATILHHREGAQPALRRALQSKNIRIQLLASIGLAQLNDKSAIPFLLQQVQRLHDQPASLVLGAILAYGDQIISSLIQAETQMPQPNLLLRALGLLQAKQALPLYERYLVHPRKPLRQLARDALEQLPSALAVQTLQRVLNNKPPAELRAELIRAISYHNSPTLFQVLLQHREDKDSSIRFLARLTLFERAQEVIKESSNPKQWTPPPARKAPQPQWEEWFKRHRPAITAVYRQRKARILRKFPVNYDPNTVLVYRTIHPMFGYGRMPVLVHDASNKQPSSPFPGKVWYFPLPTAKFKELLATFQRHNFFQLKTQTGHFRDITVVIGKQSHQVKVGQARYFAFEKLEAHFLRYARKLKLGLKFQDFHRRPDELLITKQGKIGQWAYRSYDKLRWLPWTPTKGWSGDAGVESTHGALRDIVHYLPGRTRVISFDMSKNKGRMATLLFSSRSQSRYTIERLARSRRLLKLDYKGIFVIYLSRDKIEQLHLDFLRRGIVRKSTPLQNIQTHSHTQLRAWLLKQTPLATAQTTELKVSPGPIHRITWRARFRDTHALLNTLAHIANRSQGDRLLALRINPSGESDRHTYKIVVQLQWEMLPLNKKKDVLPHYLKLGPHPKHDIFTPIYR